MGPIETMMKNNEVDDATAIFQKPAVKLFCRQLKDCQLQCDNSNISYCLVPLKSTISGKEILHPVYLIWIQGTILSIISTSQIALKDNSNGVVKVIDCDKMPGIDTWIRKGNYMKFGLFNILLCEA